MTGQHGRHFGITSRVAVLILLMLVGIPAIACETDTASIPSDSPLVAKTAPPVVTVLPPTATVVARRLPLTIQLMPADTMVSHIKQQLQRDVPEVQKGSFLHENAALTELSEEEANEYITYVPPRFVFVRARLYKTSVAEWVSFTYRGRINELLFVDELPFGAEPWAPSEFTDTVTVNGEAAYLIRGGVVVNTGSEGWEALWDPSSHRALYFRSGNRVFSIFLRGDPLTTDELVRMAESVS